MADGGLRFTRRAWPSSTASVCSLCCSWGLSASAWGGSTGNAVEVLIRSDNRRVLPLYPVAARSPNRRVYVEAVKGDLYSIIVRNLLTRRVGVVVAVDGRNIISGKQSWLRNDERMYILEPYGVGEFKGWRTSLDSINRRYFLAGFASGIAIWVR